MYLNRVWSVSQHWCILDCGRVYKPLSEEGNWCEIGLDAANMKTWVEVDREGLSSHLSKALWLVINCHNLTYSAASSLYLSHHRANYKVLELSSDLAQVVKLLEAQRSAPRTATDKVTHPLSPLFSSVFNNTDCVLRSLPHIINSSVMSVHLQALN